MNARLAGAVMSVALVVGVGGATAARGQAVDGDVGGLDADALAALPMENEGLPARPEVPQPTTRPAVETPANAPAPEKHPYLTGDWFGARTQAADFGITVEPKLVFDVAKNVRGGRDTAGGATQGLLTVPVTFDLEKIAKLKGGSVFVNFQWQRGRSASDEAGDLQGTSNIAADGRMQVSELWYKQALFDELVVAKVGKIDVTGDFMFADFAEEFMNGEMGEAASSETLPTYPDPAVGADVFVYPTKWFYAGGGVFDGARGEGVRTGENGPATVFGPPADLYLIAEVGATWNLAHGTLSGRVRGGGWEQTDVGRDGVVGGYVAVDQKVWREHAGDKDDDQGVGVFAQYDGCDSDVFAVRHHASAGAVWKGAVPGRDEDVVGLGASWARVSPEERHGEDYELAVEGFYKVQLTEYFSLKPDVQYVVNPGASGRRDAIVVGLRVELAF